MTNAARGVPPVLAIDREADEPLYRQIFEGYRDAILDGRLRPGERLPSTRSLAEDLGVSRFPVVGAFEQLLAEGYCETRRGAGTFVAASLPEEVPVAARGDRGGAPAAPAGPRDVARGPVALLGRPPFSRRGTGAFAVGGIALDQFPLRAWSTLLARRARALGPASLGYGPPEGLPALRAAIAAYLRAARGVRCDPDQVLVVCGSQQALDLAARVLLDPGSEVWIEDPGYWGAQDALRLAGARLVPVPVDGEGLNVGAGIARASEARAVFVTPSHQFPLGVTLSARRRLQLLDWARARGAWVLEDDYNGEYRYESEPITALQGLDRDARVVYVGTFSKVLSPALRIGYLVLPADLVDRFAAARHLLDIAPPTFLQAVLADFLAEGHFARHLRRTRRLYRQRRTALVQALEEMRDDLGLRFEIAGARAGLHLVIELPPGADDRAISERAAEAGVHAVPLSGCFLDPAASRPGLVLGYGGVPVEQVAEAVSLLRAALRPATDETGGWR
jgi:GntR family transcriptional regulator / MocR family aminotransferase